MQHESALSTLAVLNQQRSCAKFNARFIKRSHIFPHMLFIAKPISGELKGSEGLFWMRIRERREGRRGRGV